MKPNLTSKLKCFASVLAICTASSVVADTVTMRTNDGKVELTGEIISFDGIVYLVRTQIGEINMRVDAFTCEGASCPKLESARRNAAEDDTVTISGSDTVGEGLMPIILSGYAGNLDAEEQVIKPDGAIEAVSKFVGEQGFGDDLGSYLVRSSISGDAFANLLGRSADIGMASRRIKPDEARTLRQYGAGNMIEPSNEHIVAIDSLLVVTHPNNPVSSISMEQLRGIYTGRITNWTQVGGPDAPINAVQLSEGSGTRSVFEDRVFEGAVGGSPAQALAASGNTQVTDFVNQDETAIGYVSAAFQRGAKPMTLVSDCEIPMTPDAFSARTEEYGLGRFLYLYTRGDNTNPEVRNLVNYITSSAADDVIAKSGFIDLGVSRREQSEDTARAQMLLDGDVGAFEGEIRTKMFDEMQQYDRLSSTFRFRTGSDRLTPRSQLNLERLATYLENQPEGTDVRLVGFTDSVGAFTSNMTLAERRAASVAANLEQVAGDRLAHVNMSSTGYGEIAPASCNTDENGRSINRRVEVWVKSKSNS